MMRNLKPETACMHLVLNLPDMLGRREGHADVYTRQQVVDQCRYYARPPRCSPLSLLGNKLHAQPLK